MSKDANKETQTASTGVPKLLAEHKRLRAMLDVFEEELAAFARDAAPDYNILSESIAWCRDYINTCHHPKEDALLDKLRQRDPEGAAQCTDLSGQHIGLGESTEKLARFFDAAGGGTIFPRDELVQAGEALVRECRDHLDWEERHFFPRLERNLTASDWDQVAARFADMVDPMAASPVDDRYRVLFAVISEKTGDGAVNHG